MRILLVHQYFLDRGDGGGSRFNEMTRIWESAGHAITVIAGMVHYTTGKKYDACKGRFVVREQLTPGITVYRCHVSESYNVSFAGRLWAYFSFVFSSLFCIARLKEKHDLVLVTSPPLFVAVTGMLVSAIKRIPFVFEVRDLWPESAIDTGVLSNGFLIGLAFCLERAAYRAARLINVLTPAFEKHLKERKQIDSAKIIMIPNAADFSISEQVMRTCNRSAVRNVLGVSDKFVIIYVGAHGVANHLEQLVDAAKLLEDTNAFFLLVGEGMEKKRLVGYAMDKNVSNIRFHDAVSKQKVFEYIIAADAGTSVLKRVDTFKTVYSNKTFDYMACKKPVLMGIDGVSRELIESACCGYFAEPENAEDLARVVRLLLSDRTRAIELGENGYRYAWEHFDRQKLALRYLDALSGIL